MAWRRKPWEVSNVRRLLSIFDFKRHLTLDEFISSVSRKAKCSTMTTATKSIRANRHRLRSFRDAQADSMFEEVRRAALEGDHALESLVEKRNQPPGCGIPLCGGDFLWSLFSHLLFGLNPAVSEGFVRRVIRQCLATPTHLGFCLCHSDAIEVLAKHHPDSLDLSLFEVVISSANDSRSIYAVKAARWLPDWAAIRDCIMHSMVFDSPPKQIEAQWVVNDRGTISEVLEYMEQCGRPINVPAAEIPDLRTLTRTIARAGRKQGADGIAYMISSDGSPIPAEVQAALSAKIIRLVNLARTKRRP